MNDFIERLTRKEVQNFIHKNLNTDLQKLILKGSPFKDLSIQEIATQIEGKKRIEKKLPTWFKTEGILLPPKLNLEQSSSEITANYKAKLIRKGNLLDLTGGFGIDDFAFTQKAKHVFYCELNEELAQLVAYNFKLLGVSNIDFKIGDGQKTLEQLKKVDTIYVDPSRRANANRVFLLKDCEPNVVLAQDFYLSKADKVIIKVAPMLDISAALKELKKVSEVHIVSVNNECKELLFVLENKQEDEPQIFCALLNSQQERVFTFSYSIEKTLEIKARAIKNFLYEPDAALLKAGFFKSITQQFEVEKLHQHTHLYTSEILVEDFPGKAFKIIQKILFHNFKTNKALAKANVVTRNFHLKPEEIKKQYKIKDGGALYLFFCTDNQDQKIVLEVERLY